jgi:hypothetical protein
MTLTSTIAASITGTEAAAHDLDTASAPFALRYSQALATGTGSLQADVVWSDTRTVALSSTENLDLAGVLTSSLGVTATFVKVKGIMITALSANTNDVVVGGATSFAFPLFGDVTDTIAVRPAGLFAWAAPKVGITATAGTGDILKITNSGAGTGVTYSIVIVGTSA